MQVRFNILLYWISFVIFNVLLLDSNEEKQIYDLLSCRVISWKTRFYLKQDF